jgi:hypothetical protein
LSALLDRKKWVGVLTARKRERGVMLARFVDSIAAMMRSEAEFVPIVAYVTPKIKLEWWSG